MTYQIEVSIMRTIEWVLGGEDYTVHEALNSMLFDRLTQRDGRGAAITAFALDTPIVKIEGTSFVVSIGNP